MLDTLLAAFALVLVLEGMLPFLSPKTWKQFLQQIIKLPNRTIRIMGFFSMLTGVILLYLFK